MPLVLIGHTDNLAWSHTVSTAYRFTPFQETLVPGSTRPVPLRRPVPKHDDADTSPCTAQDPAGGTLGRRREPTATRCTRPSHGPVFNILVGVPLPVDARHRVRDGRRQRDQLPLPEPLLRDRPGAERPRARRDPAAATRASRGSTRSPPTPSGEAYYADISVDPERDRRRRRAPATRAVGVATFQRCGCRCSTARARPASGAPTPTRVAAGDLRAVAHAVAVPRRLRRRTPTTATGWPTPSSRSRASHGSSATSAPSARCAPAAA